MHMHKHRPRTHTEFVCLDTTFLINTIDIQEKGRRYSFFLSLQTCSTISHARGETTNTMQQLRTSSFLLTHFTYYFVANRLPIISRKTNKSVITRAHRLNSYHLLLFLENFLRIRQHII